MLDQESDLPVKPRLIENFRAMAEASHSAYFSENHRLTLCLEVYANPD